MYPSWTAGNLPWDPEGFPQARWEDLCPIPPTLGRPLTLALPCVGLDGACHGLQALRVPFKAKYVFDILGCLRGPLATVHGASQAEGFNLGAEGNLLLEDVTNWDRVDAVISGPPCQATSRIGLRQRADDSRCQVEEQVVQILIDQGRKGTYFFLVEGVPGILDKDPSTDQGDGAGDSHYTRWLGRITKDAPMYNIATWEMDTAAYLPQKRKRVYTIGINRMHTCKIPLCPPPPTKPRVHLAELLHPGLPPNQEAMLPPRKQADLAVIAALARARQKPTDHGGCFWLTIPLDRDITRTWGVSWRTDGCVETLRTGDELKWIMHPGYQVSRCLHPVERLSLQGFPTSLAALLGKRELLLLTGNAFSVPVVTTALVTVLTALVDEGLLQYASALRAPPSLEEERTSHKREMERHLRSEIALLEGSAYQLRKKLRRGTTD